MSVVNSVISQILNYNFGATSYTPVTGGNYYVGLSTGVINPDGSGAAEPSVSLNYSRKPIANNKTSFSTSTSGGTITNNVAVTFDESNASWGTIQYIFLATSNVVGTLDILYYEALGTPKTVQGQTTVVFNIGAMTISMAN